MRNSILLKKYVGRFLNAAGVNAVLKGININRTKILLYHSVVEEGRAAAGMDFADLCVPAKNFEENVIYLKKNCNVISIDEFISGKAVPKDRKPNVIITFDDGYMNNFTVAYPILKKHGLKAAFFITSSFMNGAEPLWFNRVERLVYFSDKKEIPPVSILPEGLPIAEEAQKNRVINLIKAKIRRISPLRFEEVLSELEAELGKMEPLPGDYCFKPMGWKNAAVMSKDPNITIGSHGKTHRPFSNMDADTLSEELKQSKSEIEEKTGKRVRYLSYPHGFYTPQVAAAARRCGYEAAFTTIHGFNDSAADPYSLRRNEIGNRGQAPIFASVVCGGWDLWNRKY